MIVARRVIALFLRSIAEQSIERGIDLIFINAPDGGGGRIGRRKS